MISRPLRDPQDADAAATCACCGGEVYAGELMYMYDRRWYCRECFADEIKREVDADPQYLARDLGVEIKEV